jgi:hypothetical protein
MSHKQRHPRQSSANKSGAARRAPIKRHAGKPSVGTNSFQNPGSPRATQMALLSQRGRFK